MRLKCVIKPLVSGLLIAPWLTAQATTYYLSSSSGNDTNNGTSSSTPWKTLDKVNNPSFDFQPGDQILFKRGEEWRGHINVLSQGLAGQPITYGAYGDENLPKPIINGAELITGWKKCNADCGNLAQVSNIYYADVNIPQELFKMNRNDAGTMYDRGISQLFINGARQVAARHPNTPPVDANNPDDLNDQYLYMEKSSGTSKFTITADDWKALPTKNLAGGHAHTKSMRWTFATQNIKSVDSATRTVTLDGNATLNDGWGYILNNKLEFIDVPGEWYYDEKTKRIYLYPPTGVDPSTAQIEGSTYLVDVLQYTTSKAPINYLLHGINVEADRANYEVEFIVLENLHLKYHSGHGIQTVHDETTIQNMTIEQPDGYGIRIARFADKGVADNHFIVKNNTILAPNSNGIRMLGSDSQIIGNTIKDVAVFENLGVHGMAGEAPKNKDGLGFAHNDGSGIRGSGDRVTISGNNLDNISHSAIFIKGVDMTIEKNVITRSCSTKADCGGIKTYYTEDYTTEYANVNLMIRDNIIINSIGNTTGAKRYTGSGIDYSIPFGMGIYIDGHPKGVTVENNTIANASYSGLLLHDASEVTFSNNISFGNQKRQLDFALGNAPYIEKNNVTGNILYSLSKDQRTVFLPKEESGTKNLLATVDNNYIFNPYTRNAPSAVSFSYKYLIEQAGVSNKYSLAQWQADSGKDKSSKTNWFELTPFQVQSVVGSVNIANNTFDAGIDIWSTFPTGTWNPDKIVAGSLEMTKGSNNATVKPNNLFTTEAGKYYRVSFKAMADQANVAIYTRIRKEDRSDAASPQMWEYFLMQPEIKNFSAVFQATTTGSDYELEFTVPSDETYKNFWLDDVIFEEVNVLPYESSEQGYSAIIGESMVNMLEGYGANFNSCLFPSKAILFYNPSSAPATIDLQGIQYVKVDNTPVSGSLSVPAYDSEVLLVDAANTLDALNPPQCKVTTSIAAGTSTTTGDDNTDGAGTTGQDTSGQGSDQTPTTSDNNTNNQGDTGSGNTVDDNVHRVPTLSQWGMLLLSMLLLMVGMMMFSHHRKQAM